MWLARSLELGSGLLCGVIGAVGLGYLLQILSRPAAPPIVPATMIYLGLVVLALIGVLWGAVLHSQAPERRSPLLLWTSTIFLVAIALFGLFSVGAVLFPSVALALLACGLSLLTRKVATPR